MITNGMIRRLCLRIAANHRNPERQEELRSEVQRLVKARRVVADHMGTDRDQREIEEAFAEQAQITGGYSWDEDMP